MNGIGSEPRTLSEMIRDEAPPECFDKVKSRVESEVVSDKKQGFLQWPKSCQAPG